MSPRPEIFISSGHARVSLCHRPYRAASKLRRPAPTALGGLSMFLVESYKDLPDGKRQRFVSIDRVRRSSATTAPVTRGAVV